MNIVHSQCSLSDDHVRLKFSFFVAIDLDRVGAAFVIESGGSTSPFSYSACSTPRDANFCIAVVPSQSTARLDPTKSYVLRLPAGSVVGEYAGPTPADMSIRYSSHPIYRSLPAYSSISFNGLYPFRFPFVDVHNIVVDETRLSLYLRHGLSSETQLTGAPISPHF